MANNITEVRLLNVPLENDYLHTLYFSSLEKQSSYFLGRAVKVYTDFNYQRKDNIIRVPAHYDSILNCNYVMYRNSAYSNKWFYAFITDMKYIDDGRTDISIETDVIQTWFFDYTVKQSFVEREHVKDDTIGLHTIPEGLEMGDYVSNSHERDENLDDLYIVYGVTSTSDGLRIGGFNYNGIYSGIQYFTSPNAELITKALNNYDEGKIDAIQCVFLAPKFLVATGDFTDVSNVGKSETAKTYDILIKKSYDLDGYTPKNNKLLTNPYNFLYVSNNNGSSAVYPYEYFNNDTNAEFRVKGALTPGCSIRLTPIYYKGTQHYDEESINLGKFPICNWNSDVYTNWLTQNSVNIATSLGAGITQIVGGAAMALGSGGIAAAIGGGSIVGGIKSIVGTMGEVSAHSAQPPQANGNINCGDVITASKRNSFHFYKMSIKKEYAEIIDKYFDMFGYKVNMLKVPNKNHRANYWYTKCIDVNIDGAIPMKDMRKIKDCYNKGITFWSNPANIGNYSVSNTINS